MKISPKRIGLWLPVLTAFSLTQAEVSADILSNRTPEQTNSEESLPDSTADPKADSIDLMRQLSVPEKVEQMGKIARLFRTSLFPLTIGGARGPMAIKHPTPISFNYRRRERMILELRFFHKQLLWPRLGIRWSINR
jgi:hypothetical protein